MRSPTFTLEATTLALAVAAIGCSATSNAPARTADATDAKVACAVYANLGPWDGATDGERASDEKPSSRASFALFLRYAALGMNDVSEGIDGQGRVAGRGADALAALGAAAANEATTLATLRSEYVARSHVLARFDAKIGGELAAIGELCARKPRPFECAKVVAQDKPGWMDAMAKLASASDSIHHAGLRQHLAAIRAFRDQSEPLRDALAKSGVAAEQRFEPLAKRFAVAQRAIAAQCGKQAPRAPGAEWIAAPRATSPRDLVAVIASQPGPSLLHDFERAANDEEQASNDVLAATYRGAERGGFGTGFFVVRRDGGERRVYLVTNRHVVAAGSTLSVRNERGELLPPADVVYEDWSADLAVLAFREQPHIAGGFAIARAPAKDGDAVTVVGFPGIGDKPAYQITRGSVSNERLEIGGARLLQHTAATDPGGSGGPVLDANGLVVGVSSAKAREREATSLAVPRQHLLAALDRAIETERRRSDDDFRRDALTDSCLVMVSAVQEGRSVPEILLSQDLVERHGLASYGELVQSGSAELQKGLDHVWTSSPLEALRMAVAIDLTKRLSPISPYEVCGFAAASASLASREVVEISISTLHGTVPVRFAFERGRYKVRGY